MMTTSYTFHIINYNFECESSVSFYYWHFWQRAGHFHFGEFEAKSQTDDAKKGTDQNRSGLSVVY